MYEYLSLFLCVASLFRFQLRADGELIMKNEFNNLTRTHMGDSMLPTADSRWLAEEQKSMQARRQRRHTGSSLHHNDSEYLPNKLEIVLYE